jgi:type II secretory pathway component PulM
VKAAVIASAWNKRSRRERLLVAAAGVLLAACLATAGGQALTRWRVAASDRLASATAEHRAVMAGLSRLRSADSARPPADAASVEQPARLKADALGLDVTIEVAAEGTTFTTAAVPSADLFEWLSAMETDHEARTSRLTVERADDGQVTAQGVLNSSRAAGAR